MDLREWLVVIGVVVIIGILIDGFRRMRMARKDALTMSKELGGEIETSPLDEDFNPELPNGGARVVGGIEPDELIADADSALAGESRMEPTFEAGDAAPAFAEMLDEDSPIVAEDRIRVEPRGAIDGASASDEIPNLRVAHAGKLKSGGGAAPHPGKSTEQPTVDRSTRSPAGEVIVINVHAKFAAGFAGKPLRELLEACGLQHGDMNVFHRHEEDDLLSPVQFSVANAVEPGYFDLAKMDSMATPGVSFFMSVPGPKNYVKAFDYMLETARCLAKNLGGEMKDEQHSVMTVQTIEHCRNRIKEFERKQLSRVK